MLLLEHWNGVRMARWVAWRGVSCGLTRTAMYQIARRMTLMKARKTAGIWEEESSVGVEQLDGYGCELG